MNKKVKVSDLKEGDKVDLDSCPYLKGHVSAEFEYAEIESIEKETDNCILISYDGIGSIGYSPDQVLEIQK